MRGITKAQRDLTTEAAQLAADAGWTVERVDRERRHMALRLVRGDSFRTVFLPVTPARVTFISLPARMRRALQETDR